MKPSLGEMLVSLHVVDCVCVFCAVRFRHIPLGSHRTGAGIAQWLERRIRKRKVTGSSPAGAAGDISSPGSTFCADSYGKKGGVWRWGKREIIYLSLHCHHQNNFCIKMGGEGHFTVSLIVRNKVTRQCPQTTTFEEKGEPKRNRTEVLPLTSLTPYR